MTALVLVQIDSTDRAGLAALLVALARASRLGEHVARWTPLHIEGAHRVAVVGGFSDADSALAFLSTPLAQEAIDSAGILAPSSIRVFEEVDRDSITSRRRSGWLRDVLQAAALPGGTPPGRSRPEPDRWATP